MWANMRVRLSGGLANVRCASVRACGYICRLVSAVSNSVVYLAAEPVGERATLVWVFSRIQKF